MRTHAAQVSVQGSLSKTATCGPVANGLFREVAACPKLYVHVQCHACVKHYCVYSPALMYIMLVTEVIYIITIMLTSYYRSPQLHVC